MVDYNAVYKDKCLMEFLRLKDCYLVSNVQRSRWEHQSDFKFRQFLSENEASTA